MSFASLLNQSGDIKRGTPTVDDMGGEDRTTWTTLHHRIACRIYYPVQLTREMMIAFDKASVIPNAVCILEHISGVKEGDRIYIEGRAFEFKLILDWDEAKKYMRISCVEVKA